VIHDQNELRGYLDPEDTNEVAMGDAKPGHGEDGAAKPPTILKPGEAAPGSQKRVLLPVPASSRTGQERACNLRPRPTTTPIGAPRLDS